jgi:hypothetical protein
MLCPQNSLPLTSLSSVRGVALTRGAAPRLSKTDARGLAGAIGHERGVSLVNPAIDANGGHPVVQTFMSY